MMPRGLDRLPMTYVSRPWTFSIVPLGRPLCIEPCEAETWGQPLERDIGENQKLTLMHSVHTGASWPVLFLNAWIGQLCRVVSY